MQVRFLQLFLIHPQKKKDEAFSVIYSVKSDKSRTSQSSIISKILLKIDALKVSIDINGTSSGKNIINLERKVQHIKTRNINEVDNEVVPPTGTTPFQVITIPNSDDKSSTKLLFREEENILSEGRTIKQLYYKKILRMMKVQLSLDRIQSTKKDQCIYKRLYATAFTAICSTGIHDIHKNKMIKKTI